MKLFFVVTFVVFNVFAVFGQTRNQIESKNNIKDDSNFYLELQVEVNEEKYCTGGNLNLHLQLKFKNLSGKNIILYRFGSIIYEHNISKKKHILSEKDIMDEAKYSFSTLGGANLWENNLLPDENYFVVIPPNQTYIPDLKRIVSVNISDENGKCKDCLHSNDYYLKIKITTWTSSRILGQSLQTRWQSEGNLWIDNLTSLPQHFTIKNIRKNEYINCSKDK